METQNTEVTAHLPEERARNVPLIGFVGSRNRAMRWCDGRQRTDGSPRSQQVSGAGFNAVLRRDKAADDEAADYLALTKDFKNPAQEPRARRLALDSPTHTIAWVVATLTILGVLTAMLMMGIAISV